jgi:hypothetical protein
MAAMSEASKHRRRWFRFRLRTMFVIVTLVSCGAAWFGGEMRFVRERRQLGEAIMAKQGYFYFDANTEIPEVPWWRKWLGDYSVDQIRVPFAHDAEFRSEAKRLFPEAAFSPISKEEIEKEVRDRDNQRRQEIEDQEMREHMRRGDWFLKDGAWTRLTPISPKSGISKKPSHNPPGDSGMTQAAIEAAALAEVVKRTSVKLDRLEASAELQGEIWEVIVWRLPKTPGGHYYVEISKTGEVKEFMRRE